MSKRSITYGIGFKVDKSGLEDLKKELKGISEKADIQLKLLDSSTNSREIEATRQQLEEVSTVAKNIGTALNESFNTKLNSISLQDFEKRLKQLSGGVIPDISKAFRGMGEEGSKAFFNLTSQLLTTKREVKETHSLTQKMVETFTNTIRWNIASSVINGFTGSIGEAWNYVQKLDNSLNDIRIVTGKSADEMERFAKKANSAAKSLGAQTTNYTNAALIYYQQGLDEEQVAARATTTVKAANVTGQSATEVSEQLTAVWNGYKVTAQEAELYVDKLAAVAAETAADLEELSTGMSKVASAASTMGIDVDQLSAQLATIISVTRQDASVVGTALKTIYSRMGDLEVDGVDEFGVTLGDVSSQLEQMGINVLDQQGNLRDMGAVVEEVAAKWGTWTKAQQQAAAVAIAGKRQYNNLFALFENWDMYESALSTSKNSAGTLQKQQEIYLDSLEAHLNKLQTSAQKAYDALVNTDSMNSLIDFLSGAVDLAATFADSIGGAGNLLMAIAPMLSKTLGKEAGSFVSTSVTNVKNAIFNRKEAAAQESALSLLQDANIGLYTSELSLKQAKKGEGAAKKSDKSDSLSADLTKDKEELKRLQSEKDYLNSIDKDLSDANSVVYSGKFMTGGKTGRAITPQGQQALDVTKSSIEKLEKYTGAAIEGSSGSDARKVAKVEIQKIDEQMTQIQNEVEAKQKAYDEEVQRLSNIGKASADQEKSDKVYSEDAQYIIDLKKRQMELSDQMTTEELNASDERIAAIAQEIGKIREKESALNDVAERYKEELKLNKENSEAELNKLKASREGLGKVRSNLEASSQDPSGEAFQKSKKTLNFYGIRTSKVTDKETISVVDNKLSKMDEEIAALEKSISESDAKLNESIDSQVSGYEKLLELRKQDLDYIQNQAEASGTVLANLQMANKKDARADEITARVEASKSGFESGSEEKYAIAKAKKMKKESTADVSQAWKASNNYITELNLSLKENTSLSSENKTVITSLISEYNSSNTTLKEKEKILEDIVNALNAEQQATKEDTIGIEKNTEALKRQQDELDRQKKGNDASDAEKKIAQVTQKITQVTGAVFGLISVFNTLSNLGSIWNDEDLSTGEKIIQTITGIIAVMTTLIPIIIQIGPSIAKSTGIGKTAMDIFGNAGVSAGTKIAAAFSYIIVPLLVITAAIVGIVALFAIVGSQESALEKATREFEEMSERADAAKNKLAELKDSYSNLMEEISKYRDTKAAIDEMRVGTEEWQKATEALNDQVESLIEKYPELADAVQTDEYGNLYLDEDAVSKAAASQRQQIKTQKAIASGLAVRASKKEEVVKAIPEYNKVLSSDPDKSFQNLSVGMNLLRLGGDLGGGAGRLGGLDLDKVEKALEKSNEYTEAQKEELRKSIEALRENNAQTEKLTAAYLKDEGEVFGYDGEVYANLVSNLDGYGAADVYTYEDYFKDGKVITIDENGKEHTVETVGKYFNTSNDRNRTSSTLQEMAAAIGTEFDASQLNWDSISTFDNLKNVVLSNGMTVEELVNQYGVQQAQAKDKENNKAIIDEQDKLRDGNRMQEAAYFNKDLVGDTKIGWDGATLDKLSTISGYGSEYKDLAEAAAATLTETIKNTLSGTGVATEDVSKFSHLTADQVNTLKNNVNAATFSGAGDIVTNAINNITDPAAMEKFQALLEKVNWSSASSINEFRAGLQEAGITIEDDQGSWEKFIASVNSGMKQWVNDANKVQEALALIRDTVEGIQMGDIVSDEEYKKMIAVNPEVAKYFVKTAGGMVAIANGKEIAGKMKAQYQDLAGIQKHYEEITTAVDNAQGNANLKKEDVTDKDSIFSYIGQEGNQQKNFKDTVKALGLAGSDNIESIIAAANNGDAAALETLSDMIMAVNQARLDVANDEYGAAAGQMVYGTSVAGSWSEANNKVGAWADVETEEKVKTYWKTNYLQILGLDTLDLDIVGALGIYELEAAAENAKKLELGYLKQIDHEINKLSLDIDNAFGSNKVKKLIDQISNQQDRAGLARAEYLTAKNQYDMGIKAAYGAGLDVFTNGELDYTKLIKNYGGLNENDSNYQLVQTLISNMEILNDKEIERQEAEQAVIDAQIEAFNSIYDTAKLARDAAKEWKKNLQSLSQFSSKAGSMAAFGEKSVTDSITEAIDLAGYNLTDTSYDSNAIEDYNRIIDIQGSKDTIYKGDEAKYQEDLDNALNAYFDTLSEMKAAGDELYQLWSSGLERISQLYEEQVAKISTINSILQSSIGLNTIFGNSVTAAYTKIRQNAANTVSLYQGQVTALKAEYDKYFGEDGKIVEGSDESKATEAWDAYAAAQQNFVNALQEQYQAIQDEFAASLNDIIKTAFGGVSFDNVSELWNLEKAQDDIYFDETNAKYEQYKLERSMQKSIDATDNIAAQNKLKKVMEEQLDILKQKEKISQADIDNANAVYDLTLKQIALEEAQNTADKMKLTRDASGNYTYQYVADQDKIAQAEEDLAAAENNLYNLQKKHQEELIDTLLSGVQQYQELLIKYMNDPEMTEKINEYYKEYFDNLGEDFEGLDIDLDKITTVFGNGATFDSITSAVQGATALLDGEEGFTKMIESFKTSVDTMNDETTGITTIVNKLGGYVESAGAIKNQTDVISEKMELAKKAMEGLSGSLSDHVAKLEGLINGKDGTDGYINYLNANTTALSGLKGSLDKVVSEGIPVYTDLVSGATTRGASVAGDTALNTKTTGNVALKMY